MDQDQDPEDDDDSLVDGELSEEAEHSSDNGYSVLEDTVKTLKGSADIKALHAVIRCVLLRDDQGAINRPLRERFDTFLERWIALYHLRSDGSFQPANDCTRAFSIISYHIRSTILVEALISPLPSGESYSE